MKALAGLVLSFAAMSTAFAAPVTEVIPNSDYKIIENQVQALLKKDSSLGIKNLKIDWSKGSLRCDPVTSEMSPETIFGVCSVSASAFQVEAKLAIVKSSTGYSVKIIYADVE